MPRDTDDVFEFGAFRLEKKEQTLLRDGTAVPVTPKVFETLVFFLRNPGRLIQKDELMEALWPDRFVEEGNLTFHVGMLRKALGDNSANPTFIETVPRRGYRFIAEVSPRNGELNGNVDAFAPTPENLSAVNPQISLGSAAAFINGSDTEHAAIAIQERSRRSSWLNFIVISAAVIGIVAAVTLFLGNKQTYFERIAASPPLTVEKISDTGNMLAANFSADGKFMIYHSDEGHRSTLWLRQTASGNTIPLLVLTDEFFSALGFSADGEFIYFTHLRKGEAPVLSRIPTLGGSPTRVLSGLHGGWTLSPDALQIAFTRFDAEGSRVIVANADGSNEREVFFSPKPRFVYGVNWSPDGKSLAYCVGAPAFDKSGAGFGIYNLRLSDGTVSTLSEHPWSFIENLEWLPDQSGLFVTAKEKKDDTDQIWLVSHPEGKATKLTNDSRALSLRGATADLSKILATQKSLESKVWIAPVDDPSATTPIGPAEWDVAWTKENELVFPTRQSIKSDLWTADRDGGERRQLTASPALERAPTVSPDGRFIVYVSSENDHQNLWRMDVSGGEKRRLTDGDGASFPTFTPDGEWIVYTAVKTGTLWKVPVDGGEAKQVCTEWIQRVGVSPDGKFLAHFGRNKDNKRMLQIRNMSNCSLVREFVVPVVTAYSPKTVWAKDGKSIIYSLDNSTAVGNLWRQSLDGGEAQKLTEFTSEQLFDFAFSADGKWIAFVRGKWKFDAVLLQGVK